MQTSTAIVLLRGPFGDPGVKVYTTIFYTEADHNTSILLRKIIGGSLKGIFIVNEASRISGNVATTRGSFCSIRRSKSKLFQTFFCKNINY
jgi:hypothetical protein